MRVDLPAPFSPITACTSPARTSSVTSESTVTAPYALVSRTAASAGVRVCRPVTAWCVSDIGKVAIMSFKCRNKPLARLRDVLAHDGFRGVRVSFTHCGQQGFVFSQRIFRDSAVIHEPEQMKVDM